MEENSLLTEEEVEKMIIAASKYKVDSHEGVTEDQMREIIRWAENARIDCQMIDMVLEGKLAVGWNGEDIVFHLTKEGHKEAEKIIGGISNE